MDTPEIIATKNPRAKIVDIVKIIIGGILSFGVIVLLIIFHEFVSGYISPVDILLLLLFLTGSLFISGCRGLRFHNLMPSVMLTYCDGYFLIFNETVYPEEIKMIKYTGDSGKSGKIVVMLENRKYTLYGVNEYRKAALRIVIILADHGVEPFKSVREKYEKK